jgi:hypothetical protein
LTKKIADEGPDAEKEGNEEVIDSSAKTAADIGAAICPNLLYRITISNKHAQSVKVKLSFNPLKPESEIDLVWPRSGIKDFVKSGYTSHLLTLRRRTASTVSGEAPEIDNLDI